MREKEIERDMIYVMRESRERLAREMTESRERLVRERGERVERN